MIAKSNQQPSNGLVSSLPSALSPEQAMVAPSLDEKTKKAAVADPDFTAASWRMVSM